MTGKEANKQTTSEKCNNCDQLTCATLALSGLLPCSAAHPIHNLADSADLRVHGSLRRLLSFPFHRLLGQLTGITGLFGLVSEDGQTELSAEVCVAVVAYWNGDHVPGLTDISVRKHSHDWNLKVFLAQVAYITCGCSTCYTGSSCGSWRRAGTQSNTQWSRRAALIPSSGTLSGLSAGSKVNRKKKKRVIDQ